MSVTVKVDSAKCVGHGRCYELAPTSSARTSAATAPSLLATVPPEHEKAALVAAASCPEDAIKLARS